MKEVDDNEQISDNAITCPHCLHEHLDALEICSPDEYDGVAFRCESCGEDIKVYCEVTFVWTTMKVLKNE